MLVAPSHFKKIAGLGSACILTALSVNGCGFGDRSGVLRVASSTGGLYEIYRIASDNPLQLVSEHVGQFNEDIKLPAGRYLVLADCSSQSVHVYAGQTKELVANQVNFLPSMAPDQQDRFSIQCERAEKTRSRQFFSSRFSLNMIGESHDILVGMVPLSLDFDHEAPAPQGPRSFLLSALKVEATTGTSPDMKYFVSPATNLVAVTEQQSFGHWMYLLPGEYEVEVNGTKMKVTLVEGEKRVIRPAFLKITTNDKVDLDLSSQIRGTPLFVEVNNGHWFNLNEQYAVLPGAPRLRLSGSNQPQTVELEEGESVEMRARSVKVDQGCSPWEWNCLGDLEVHLYQPGQPFPFNEGVTDVPLLFFEQEVHLGVEGSRNIRKRIPKGVSDLELHLGYLEIIPKPVYVKGQITDLLRVEAHDPELTGVTLDINPERPTRMPLVTGQYQLAHYVMSTATEGERRRSSQPVRISRDQTITVQIQVFISEKKIAGAKKPGSETSVATSGQADLRDIPESRSHEIERLEKSAGTPRIARF
ncbi:MAG: hypothetical protein RIQ81_1714 [Pseudomonadota bacterium]